MTAPWTELDESRLNSLTKRKAKFELHRMQPLVDLCEQMECQYSDADRCADQLRLYAEPLRDALKAFDSREVESA